MKGLIIRTDGTTEVVMWNRRDDSYKLFTEAVGGYIIELPQNFHSKATIYCNEDGERLRLPPNKLATFLSGLYPQLVTLGDVIVVGAADENGNDQSLPDEVIDAIQAIDVEATWDNYHAAIETARMKTALVKERRAAT